MDDFLIRDGAVIASVGITVPVNAIQPYGNFSKPTSLYLPMAPSGSCMRGSTRPTSSDGVIVVNGAVLLREGNTFPILGETTRSISRASMSGNGDWFAVGDTTANKDWLVYNNQFVASTGSIVPGGLPGETFGTESFSYAFSPGRSVGPDDFTYVGVTNNPNHDEDEVFVHSTKGVFMRENDQVDLNGDGILNENVFIHHFVGDSFLAANGKLYTTCTLQNASGTFLEQAFIVIQARENICYADCDGNTVLNILDYICFGNAYATNDPYADCDGNSVLNILDYICFGNAYAVGCP